MRAAIPAVFAVALVSASGCAYFPSTLEEEGIVQIKLQDGQRIHLETVNAFPDGEGFKLRGTVRRFSFQGTGPIRGHVDVSMCTADGQELSKLGVQLVPRARPRHTGRKADFTVRFDARPARGSVLAVTFHEGSHSPSEPGSSGGLSGGLPGVQCIPAQKSAPAETPGPLS